MSTQYSACSRDRPDGRLAEARLDVEDAAKTRHHRYAPGFVAEVRQPRALPSHSVARLTMRPMSELMAIQVKPYSRYRDQLGVGADDADRLAGLGTAAPHRELRLHVGMIDVAQVPHRRRKIGGSDEERVDARHRGDLRQARRGGGRLDLHDHADLGRGRVSK